MSLPQRIEKLVEKISTLTEHLTAEQRDRILHGSIDLYYYIQKTEELKLLHEALMNFRMDAEVVMFHYKEVYCRWRRDVRWLNQYTLRPGLFY
jgi:hypothetical protein